MTRQRIIDAARQVLTAQPLRSFNLSEVAELARVVRSTIYTVFGSREGLLRAVAQDMNERGGWERMRKAFRDPDAWVAIRRNIEEGTRMVAIRAPGRPGDQRPGRGRPGCRGGRGRAWTSSGCGACESLARRLGEQGYLRPELDHEQAVEILWVLTSWNTFDQLYSGRGLDQPAAAERLVTMARLTLCRPETMPPGASTDEHRHHH